MFESDDFDQILSQFDISDETAKIVKNSSIIDENIVLGKFNTNNQIQLSALLNDLNENVNGEKTTQNENPLTLKQNQILEPTHLKTIPSFGKENSHALPVPATSNNHVNKETYLSPKHTKRKIIDSHFDHKSKRKFPGPAGLLTGTLEENNDESINQMELLSQDLEFSQNNLRRDLFESPIWLHLLQDIQSWNLDSIDSIKSIKQQAMTGNLKLRKAQTVTAFVETIDRSVTDPLIILRDTTGHIKCTLHRDAWSTFSTYIVSEYCFLMLRRPTVLTTGSAFKKHYLNITLSNIFAIYSSAVVNEEEKQLPDGYERIFKEDFTVIKMQGSPQDIGETVNISHDKNEVSEDNNLLNDLESIFSDDLF